MAHGHTVTAETIRLIYVGKLPRMNRQQPSYWWRYQLRRRAQAQFGMLPRSHWATRAGVVTITRVLGPRERLMDEFDNLRYAMKGLVDALVTCGYLVDDSPQWASFTVGQDATRRADGPMVEISITYDQNEGRRRMAESLTEAITPREDG